MTIPSPDDDDRTLTVDSLTVTFGGLTALDQVSVVAHPGEVVGVIGPNGAGKTTLFNVICGFVRSGTGRIAYGGTSLGRHHPHDLNRLGIAPDAAGRRPVPGPDGPGERHVGCVVPGQRRPRLRVPRLLAFDPRGTAPGQGSDRHSGRARHRGLRHATPVNPPLCHSEAHLHCPRAHGRTDAAPPGRAGQRTVGRGDGRTGRTDPDA